MCTHTRAIWKIEEREKKMCLHDFHLFVTVTIKYHFDYRDGKRSGSKQKKIADRCEHKKEANCEQ